MVKIKSINLINQINWSIKTENFKERGYMLSKFKMTTAIGLISAQIACASPQAGYYRVWQGFKKQNLNENDFQQKIPAFMNATIQVYTGVLNNYLVALPPKNKPSFVPDEFALVALRSEQDYRQIRSTPSGQIYSDQHWDVFNKENSRSAPYEFFGLNSPAVLEHNRAYDMIGEAIDWKQGHSTFFIGLRKNNLTSAEYLRWLSQHVSEVARVLRPYGLRGYIVIANENYEVAFMNWSSAEARTAAFTTAEGQKIRADISIYMDRLQSSQMQKFDGSTAQENTFYNTGMD